MTKTVSMTEGDIKKQILFFSMPLIICNIFQQFYNLIDTLFAVYFLNKTIYAALGVAGSIMNLFIFILIGFSNGVSNLLARYLGFKDLANFKRAVAISLIGGIVITVLVGLGVIRYLDKILFIMNTPASLVQYAKDYLSVIFAGIVFIYLYNLFAAVFRALGDSRTPLQILISSTLVHILIGYIFVVYFHMEATGLGLATILSQIFSVALCVFFLYRNHNEVFLTKEDFTSIPSFVVRRTVSYGSISAFQQSSLFIGKIIIQRMINAGGVDVIAAFTACTNVDGFVSVVGNSGDSTMSIFAGQNAGSGQGQRIKKGFKITSIIFIILGICVALILLTFAEPLMAIFIETSDNAVLQMGVGYLRAIALFYIITYWSNILNGFLRGMGKITIPFISSTIQIVIRVTLSSILLSATSLTGLAIASGIGWSIQIVFLLWNVAVTHRELDMEEKKEEFA